VSCELSRTDLSLLCVDHVLKVALVLLGELGALLLKPLLLLVLEQLVLEGQILQDKEKIKQSVDGK